MKPNCDEPLTQAVDRPKRGVLFTLIVVIFAVVILSHVVFPLLGLTLVLTAAAASVLLWALPAMLAIAVVLFLMPLFGALLLGGAVSVAILLSIILFPVLLPIVLPVWIFCAVMAYLFRS